VAVTVFDLYGSSARFHASDRLATGPNPGQKKQKYNKIETVKGKQEAETTGRKSVVLKAHLHISFGFRLHI